MAGIVHQTQFSNAEQEGRHSFQDSCGIQIHVPDEFDTSQTEERAGATEIYLEGRRRSDPNYTIRQGVSTMIACYFCLDTTGNFSVILGI